MKRDVDLIRQILLIIEEADDGATKWVDLEIPDRDKVDVAYHVMLLSQAGLIVAINLSSKDGVDWRPRRLTWEGHEFLDAARDEAIWQQAKAKIESVTGSAGLGTLHSLLIRLGGQALGSEP